MPWRNLGFQFGFAWDKRMSQTWLFWVSQWSQFFQPKNYKVFHHKKFSYNHYLGFIFLSSVTWSCSLLSHAPLCFVLIYSGEIKPQFFFALAFLCYPVLFYLCVILSWSACLCFPGGFLLAAVLWRINPRIFCFSFFLPKRMTLGILLVPIATELCVKLALEHLLKVIL